MIKDLAAGAAPGAPECDLLIVGAGPAGITLALELARLRPQLDIVLLEGGGRSPPGEPGRDLYRGRSTGPSPYPLEATRLRYLGGTSGHWGGWCRPFDEVDFQGGSGASPAWPITLDELAPFYAAAHRWLEIPSDDYAPEGRDPELRQRLLDFDDSPDFRNRLFRFSPPTRFGKRYREALETSSGIRCLLHATLLQLSASGRRIDGALLAGGDGRQHRMRARQVVLAQGGIESTRQLLLMRAAGIHFEGLASDALGRGFADHSGLRPGELMLAADRCYRRDSDSSGALMPVIAPRPEALERHGWQNACIMLEPEAGADTLPRAYASHAALRFPGGEAWRYAVQMILEPRRNPDSRIELDDDTDAFGRPRVRVHWAVHPGDSASGASMFAALVGELSRRGLGRGRIWPLDPEQLATRASAASHHLGCARMAEHAADGVVDPQLRVHGCDNLWLASTASFPGAGYSNPTLTLVALAQRLAARLAAEHPA